jgi:hypothetical protein
MRWLKLWPIGQLHRRLLNKHTPHIDAIKMIYASGLAAVNTASRA